ncbi:MAG: hypothetical protein ACE5E7_14195 [Anaerolineae bacterium]
MLKNLSIKELYALALAEGEGVGTAYEYFAKRLLLKRWLKEQERPSRMLIAGLPEKYGSSLDFLQLALELEAEVTVVDERPFALNKLQTSLAAAQEKGWLTAVSLTIYLVLDIAFLNEINGSFDLCISSEVLQRLAGNEQTCYIQQLSRLAPSVAIFSPNGDNPSHTNISGLSGVGLDELRSHITQMPHQPVTMSGYVDMPPFPPGITRSEDQREQAASGIFEAVAMGGLGYYARLEHWMPAAIRCRHSHITYVFLQS